MKEENKGSNVFWAWAGKISLLLTAIWVLIQIYNHFISPGDYKLVADGDYAPFEYPYPDLLQKEIEKTKHPPFEKIRYTFWFTIRNEGKKEITNLKFDLPFDGIYTIENNDSKPSYLIFKRSISLGSLHPANEINIIVWTYYRPISVSSYSTNNKNFIISHPNGYVNVSFPIKVREYPVIIIMFLYELKYLILILLALIIILLFFAREATKKKTQNIEKTNGN